MKDSSFASQRKQAPRQQCRYFIKFCREKQLKGEIIDNTDEINIKKGEAYIVIRQIDVVNIIKKSRAEGLKCGSDFGVLAYNDTPSYEVIDQGITSISIDWENNGKAGSRFCSVRQRNKRIPADRSTHQAFFITEKQE